jgi:hypothetical protein
VALDALLAGSGGVTAVSVGYTLTDTNAQLLTQDGAGEAVDDAAIVNVTDAISVAEVGALETAYTITGDDAVLGTSLNYDLADTPANILGAAGGEEAGASSITATAAADTAARAVDMEAVGATFSINGDIAEIHTDAAVTDAVLDAATTVTVTDTVSNFETGTNLADMVADASFR